MDDRDAVAEPLCFLEVMGGDQDRQIAACPQARDHVEQLVADPRVEADGRLVEEQDNRLRDERAGDLEPAALTPAVAADGTVDQLRETERFGQLTDPTSGARAPKPRVELEILVSREGPIDDRLLEYDAADAAREQRVAGDVVAADRRSSRGRDDRRGEHSDRGRLAGTVGAKQSEHLAGVDLKVDALDRPDTARVGL